MVIAEVCVIPIGTTSTSISEQVAAAVKAARNLNIKFQLTPMGTIIEGDLDKVLEAIKMMHNAAFLDKTNRVLTVIKIDDRRDKPQTTMEYKMESVLCKL